MNTSHKYFKFHIGSRKIIFLKLTWKFQIQDTNKGDIYFYLYMYAYLSIYGIYTSLRPSLTVISLVFAQLVTNT